MAADLHNQSYGPDNARLAEAILALEPDAVLAAGDLLIGRPGETFLPALSLLRRLRRAQIPVYYGNGNHEYRMRLHPEIYGKVYAEYAEALRDCGVILLENEKASFEAEGLGAEIYGFELPESYYRKFAREELKEEELEQVLGKPDEEKYNILIAHNPGLFSGLCPLGRGSDRVRTPSRRNHPNPGHRRNHHASGQAVSEVRRRPFPAGGKGSGGKQRTGDPYRESAHL